MGGGAQVIHTVCMDTRDAIERKDSRMTFCLGGDNPRFQALKVSLGSLEFPITQWTVEEDWNRIYFSEGFCIVPETSFFRVCESTDNDGHNEFVMQLPPTLNEIVSICETRRGIRVKCRHNHGLFVGGGRCLLDSVDWGEAEILCSSIGRVSLSSIAAAGQLEYVNETEFLLPTARCDTSSQGGFVYIPTVPSPQSLCHLISSVLTRIQSLARYELTYDARNNKATLQATLFPENSKELEVRLYGSELASILGYTSAIHERRFKRTLRPTDFQSTQSFDFFADRDDKPPLKLASDPFAGWTHVELDLGWYTPSQRPMCTGQPLRFTNELELALNRSFFPTPERIPQGMATAHFLMFTDPSGELHNCPIYAGRYTPESLCAVLEAGMTRLSNVPRTYFTVEYDRVEERFTFVCEVKDEKGAVRPAAFGLVFNHPAQFDPSRIGFPGVALYGCDSYTSPTRVVFPMKTAGLRDASNFYRVSEIGHQKRLRIQSSPGSQLTGLIVDYESTRHILKLRTFAGQLPFAHGLTPGSVVQITGASSVTELFRFQNGEWKLDNYRSCPIAPSCGRSAVVVQTEQVGRCGEPMPGLEPIELHVRVRPTPEIVDMIGTTVTINVEVQPFNLCFGLAKSFSNVSMGFPSGATQWGMDGIGISGKWRIPPYDAPALHSLDHPDYVLIYFEEGNRQTGLQHQFGTTTTTPFCKLVLYPMFREERMLPRDTTLLSGESFAKFTIRFSNPDGTPYHFHGAEFSFSLNFIKVQE